MEKASKQDLKEIGSWMKKHYILSGILILIILGIFSSLFDSEKSIEDVQNVLDTDKKLNEAIQSTKVYEYFDNKNKELNFGYANSTWFLKFLETFNEEEFCQKTILPSNKYMAAGSGYFLLVNAETYQVECDYLNLEEDNNQLGNTEYEKDIELSDDLKKELAILLLESSPYDYSVIRIVLDYSQELGNYASIGMISKGETTVEVAEQVGAGLGALYGNWNNKDYYAVALNNYIEICTFAVDGVTTKNFMDGKISDIELFLNLQSICIPAS